MKKTKLVFVSRRSKANIGSSVLRVKQLAQRMSASFGDRYDVQVTHVSPKARALWVGLLRARFPGAVFVFSKWAAEGWTGDDFAALSRSSAAVFVDYVDEYVDQMVPFGVTGHISTSVTGTRLLRARQDVLRNQGATVEGGIYTVLHGYDARLDGFVSAAPQDCMRMAYLGSRHVMLNLPELEDEIAILHGGSVATFEDSLKKLPAYNAHYALREPTGKGERRRANPFTKGATAAACDAVVMVDRHTDDAIELLGTDYPYLAQNSESDTVIAMFDYMRESFGTSDWRDAQEAMKTLKARLSPQAVAEQLDRAIRDNQ